MKKTILIGLFFLVGVLGCTAVTSTEPPTETAVPTQPVEPGEQNLEENPVIETPESEPTPTEDDGKQISEPVTVDLNALTPVPIDSTPIVQPAPGIPGNRTEPVLLAIEDLSNRLNVNIAAIELISLQDVTWQDGSLGCPESGMNYIQVLTPGQQLILRVDGKDYHYHSGKGTIFEYCGNPLPPIESMPINPNQPSPPGQDE